MSAFCLCGLNLCTTHTQIFFSFNSCTMKQWRDDSSVALVILKGSGGKAFAAGGDVKGICKLKKVFYVVKYVNCSVIKGRLVLLYCFP